MIAIDMPMPRACRDCPCSHLIQAGDLDGRMMCGAMEYSKPWMDRCFYLVDEYKKRPDCPMVKIDRPFMWFK